MCAGYGDPRLADQAHVARTDTSKRDSRDSSDYPSGPDGPQACGRGSRPSHSRVTSATPHRGVITTMSQPTSSNHPALDSNTTPEGAPEQKVRPRRRRAAAHPKDTSATQAPAPVAPATPVAAPVAAAAEPAPPSGEAPHHRANGR